jgi:uncharacterized surface protein with fasciclin (FAS1) repeats
MNIVETAIANDNLSTLVKALQAAALVETLSGAGPFTVFAPTDLAFAKLPPGVLARLLDPKNVKQLQAILLYHVASGNLPSTDFAPRQEVTTINGASVLIVSNRTAPPPYGAAQVFVNQALVQTPNVICTNGIVHIINSVLLPPSLLETLAAEGAAAAPTAADTTVAAPMNIVETANATADLSTLVKAIVAGALNGTLSGAGPFTVFAPTDIAFDELPEGTLAKLLDPSNLKQLQVLVRNFASP